MGTQLVFISSFQENFGVVFLVILTYSVLVNKRPVKSVVRYGSGTTHNRKTKRDEQGYHGIGDRYMRTRAGGGWIGMDRKGTLLKYEPYFSYMDMTQVAEIKKEQMLQDKKRRWQQHSNGKNNSGIRGSGRNHQEKTV